jgi:hypothetical protein
MEQLEDEHVSQIPLERAQRHPSPVRSFDGNQHLELLHRVANSRSFSTCHTLRAFLLYVGEQAIAGKLDAIKEQQIGSRVLGRKPDYDPAEDNIVRVRARQLRQRLSEYFAGEGSDEPVVVSIPKGHYVPVFEPRTRALTDAPEPPVSPPSISNSDLPPEPQADLKIHRFSIRAGLVLAAAAIIAAVVPLLWSMHRTKPATEASSNQTTAPLWAQLFPTGGPELTVVAADAGFALWQDITDRSLNLGDYLSRGWYTKGATADVKMREIAVRRFTSPADLSLAVRIAEIAGSYNGRVRVKFARNVDIHEVRAGNLVLIGSRRSNPWVELFEPRMNFVLEYDRSHRGPAFRNRSPKPGEPDFVALDSSLSVQGPETKLIESYAVAALLPSPTDRGHVLIVEGLSMEGTEAAGEFVTNPKRFATLLRRIGQKTDRPIKPFEVLLGLTAVAGGYADPELIAYRYPTQ